MNRIELYVDRNNRLTLDFYYELSDNYPISQFKGEKCYNIISKLCETRILSIKDNEQLKEVSLTFKDCILNVSEYEQVFRKKGTGPIKRNLCTYYEEEKKKAFKPRKVKRKNKYIGKQIVAGALVLSVLGFIVAKEVSDKNKSKYDDSLETTISYETEIPTETILQEETLEETLKQGTEIINLDISDVKDAIDKSSDINIFISFEDTSNTDKAKKTRAYYGDIIKKYSEMYGLNPEIVTAIATQERGIHSTEMDSGGATGLMQLQNSVWVGNQVTAYNYETNSYETFNITKDNISDLFCNIKGGCMYFQNCMNYMDGNILAAIQCYNMGYGSMCTILKECSRQTGKPVSDILNDISDCTWLEYRSMLVDGNPIPGDPIYLENVLRWLGSNIEIDNLKINGDVVNINVTNEVPTKVR